MKVKRNRIKKKTARITSRGPEHALWSKLVKIRDQYRCITCGEEKKNLLHAHHIKDWESFPELRYSLENGITLCLRCHAKEHPSIAHLILRLHRLKTIKTNRVIKIRKIKL